MVDCAGLDLRVFPDNITREARYLSLQVGLGRKTEEGKSVGSEGWGSPRAGGGHGQ